MQIYEAYEIYEDDLGQVSLRYYAIRSTVETNPNFT